MITKKNDLNVHVKLTATRSSTIICIGGGTGEGGGRGRTKKNIPLSYAADFFQRGGVDLGGNYVVSRNKVAL